MNKKSSAATIGGGIAAAVIIVAFMFSWMSNELQSIDSLVDDTNENSVEDLAWIMPRS